MLTKIFSFAVNATLVSLGLPYLLLAKSDISSEFAQQEWQSNLCAPCRRPSNLPIANAATGIYYSGSSSNSNSLGYFAAVIVFSVAFAILFVLLAQVFIKISAYRFVLQNKAVDGLRCDAEHPT